jgi:hypothetical protein
MDLSRSRRAVIAGLSLCAALTVGSFQDSPGADPAAPLGWIKAGNARADYDVGLDQTVVRTGRSSAYLRSRPGGSSGFGTLMQSCSGDILRGNRVRMSAWVKSDGVSRGAGLWMRVDGAYFKEPLAFDNMHSRRIRGTQDWTRYEIVLDVPPEASRLAYGILLEGEGAVWLDDLSFEPVDASVPTTGGGGGATLFPDPRNLDFEE